MIFNKIIQTNDDYYTMLITPLDEAKGLLDNFTILYDTKKKLIIEVTSYLSPTIVAKLKTELQLVQKHLQIIL